MKKIQIVTPNILITLLLISINNFILAKSTVPFDKATITKVVKKVDIVQVPSLRRSPANINDVFQAPNLIQTGRKSQAQLTFPDGTLARVGSNTVCSFESAMRQINLEQGSILFNSKTGRGGGRIVTAAATASVLGTTIIVATTPDGGFKLLVIEGTAKVVFSDNTQNILSAGQMTFILPGTKNQSGVKNSPNNKAAPPPGTPPNGSVNNRDRPGKPGPILNFDLKRQTSNSNLVQGYGVPLPSSEKIEMAVNKQNNKIKKGKFEETDLLVLDANGEGELKVLDPTVVENGMPTREEIDQALDSALKSTVVFNDNVFPMENIFMREKIRPEMSSFLASAGDGEYEGFIGGDVTINFNELNFNTLDGPNTLDFAVNNMLTINNNVAFTGFNQTREFNITYDQLAFKTDTGISVNFTPLQQMDQIPTGMGMGQMPTTQQTSIFKFISSGITNLNQNNFNVDNGSFTMQNIDGDLNWNTGNVNLNGSGGDFEIAADNSINVDNLGVNSSIPNSTPTAIVRLFSKVINLTNSNINTVNIEAKRPMNRQQATDIAFRNITLANTMNVNLEANTITLLNINFLQGSMVNLRSVQGQLAANPNTNATVQPGFVNFVNNVTYNNEPAQNHVSIANGGTGLQAENIIIGTL